MTALQYLFLGNNSFSGGDLIGEIGHLNNLRQLDMKFCRLTGPLPPTIFNMSQLLSIDLSYNNISGILPREIGNMRALIQLYLDNNAISDNIPKDIGNLNNLQWLGLGGNELSGSLPREIGNMTALQYIGVHWNILSGNIPEEIGDLNNLQAVEMESNKFIGPLPPAILSISSLKYIYLSNNTLSGELPREIGKVKELGPLYLQNNTLSSLIDIDLSNNNFEGSIPQDFGRSPNLRILNLAQNQLEGSIPQQLGRSPNLRILNLGENQLSGLIPSSIWNLSNIVGVILYSNKLTGEIPSSICNLRFLQALYLSNNSLEGPIPQCLGNMSKSLHSIYLNANNFNGIIPTTFTKGCSLLSLSLNGNKLEGTLSQSLVNCQNMRFLDIGNNEIQGIFPFWLEALPHLRVLVLRSNRFNGTISRASSNSNVRFPKLQVLDISRNAFIGTLPEKYLKNFRAMINATENVTEERILSSYDHSTFILKGLEQLFMKISTTFTTIDLSFNKFSGSIPKSIGNLDSLVYLNLSHNSLTGHIPSSLGNVTALESLDLSSNRLDGEIPRQLTRLTFLSTLNLSMNNLVGKIPQSSQFSTFDNSSYIGNSGLCGLPLTKKCEGDDGVLLPKEEDDDDLCGAPRFNAHPCHVHNSRRAKKLQVVFVSVGLVVVIIAAMVILVIMRYQKQNQPPSLLDFLSPLRQRTISYYELQRATDGFNESNLLGIGGFGVVYKGVLRDGTLLAVKVLNLEVEGALKSFDAECEVLRNLRHRNLTKVISSCSNNSFKALVLDYMPKGSLERWLYSHNYFLDIIQRLNIMIDVASALEYLHHGYTRPVIHCDLKPSNVLLDDDMVAHVSDFGMAKMLGEEDSITHTRTLATMGYMAPEYGMEGIISPRCDIYSYGIMLMEVFMRTKPNDERFVGDFSMKDCVQNSVPNDVMQIVDANLLDPNDQHFTGKLNCLTSIMELALRCTAESPRERSGMKDVLSELKKIKHGLLAYIEGGRQQNRHERRS